MVAHRRGLLPLLAGSATSFILAGHHLRGSKHHFLCSCKACSLAISDQYWQSGSRIGKVARVSVNGKVYEAQVVVLRGDCGISMSKTKWNQGVQAQRLLLEPQESLAPSS